MFSVPLMLFILIKKDSLGLGVYLPVMLCVGVERFELSTSRTRTVRSTGLSHTPKAKQRGRLYLIFLPADYGFNRISRVYI
jgi:hypothetical protein